MLVTAAPRRAGRHRVSTAAARSRRCLPYRRPVCAAAAPNAAAQLAPDNPKRWWGVMQRNSSTSSPSSSSGTAWQHGKPAAPHVQELAAAVAPLAEACGADAAKLVQAVAFLPPAMRQGVLAHGPGVAAYLSGLGAGRPLLAAALRRCLPLFSRPTAERAQVLVGQLVAAGLTPDEVLRCFEAAPSLAGCGSCQEALAELASLLAAGQPSEQPRQEQQEQQQPGLAPVAALLRAQPAAAAVLALRPADLRARAAYLQQELGVEPGRLAAALRRDAQLLLLSREQLEEQAAALEEELGAGRPLFAELATAAGSTLFDLAFCVEELQHAAMALAAEFGQPTALRMVLGAPQLLGTQPATWREDLRTLGLLWVDDPTALAQRSPRLLCQDLASPACVATRLLLQCVFGLSAAGVYERLPARAAASEAAEALAGRLCFLEEAGLPLPLLPAASEAASGAVDSPEAAAEEGGLSLADLAALSDDELLARLQQLAERHRHPRPASIAAAFQAFRSSFGASPAYCHLQAEAAAESARLQRLLRPT